MECKVKGKDSPCAMPQNNDIYSLHPSLCRWNRDHQKYLKVWHLKEIGNMWGLEDSQFDSTIFLDSLDVSDNWMLEG